jgi:sulfite exporter TauE/SafE
MQPEMCAMTLNVGTIDRLIRFIIGAVLIAFALNMIAPNTGWNWVGWIGVLPVITALIGYCPAYSLFGISTDVKQT